MILFFTKFKVLLWNIKKKKIAIKIYVKITSLLSSILGWSTAYTRPMHIYMSVGVFNLPIEKTNTNVTILNKFFEMCFQTKYKFFHIKM